MLLASLLASLFAGPPPRSACAQTKRAQTDHPAYDRTLHVAARGGNDRGPGTAARPLRTIQAAMDQAADNKKERLSTKVVIGPGVYREAVTFAFTNHPDAQPDNPTPVLVQGAGPGQTVISGADVLRDWRADGARLVHPWPHDWGQAEDPTGGRIPKPEIVLRREMIFVEGERLRQVLARRALEPGTFFVDERADSLYLRPPAGRASEEIVSGAVRVEASVRGRGWYTQYEDHLTLRGFSVRHVATPWVYGEGAIVVTASADARLEAVEALQNNFIGFTLQQNTGTVLARATANRNGHSGWGLWKNIDFRAEDVDLSYNNWRGVQGGYTFWGPGNKSLSMHGFTVRGLRAVGNHSRGLWLDTDHTEAVLEDLELRGNLADGLFLEANPGPIRLRHSTIQANGGFGIMNANSARVTLVGNAILYNEEGGLQISGENEGRDMTNFETDARFQVRTTDWALTGNVIASRTGPLIATTLGPEAWQRFIRTLASDENTWHHPRRGEVFAWPASAPLSLEQWQRRTGLDQRSVFAPPAPSAQP